MSKQHSHKLAMMLAFVYLALAACLVQVHAQEDEPPPEIPAAIVDPSIEIEELRLRLAPLSREELAAVAGTWFEIIKSKTQDLVDAQLTMAEEDGEPNQDARDVYMHILDERKALFDRFDTVLSSWEKKGGAANKISEYQTYQSAVTVEQIQTTDFKTLVQQVREWALSSDGGLRYLKKIMIIIIALIVLVAVSRLASRFARRASARSQNISKLLEGFLVLVVYWIVFVFGFMLVLSALGVDVSPLFALIGGASFILAFALQSSLGNLAAGLMIMINRPFDAGDLINIAGVLGTVESVSIFSTKLVTPDNQIIIVPNSNVWNNVIRNVSASPTRRVDLTFGIGYDDNIETAQRVLEETVMKHALVLHDPAPVIRVGELGDSSVNFIVRPWVKIDDYWTVYWDLTRQVKEAFDSNGISIPFPQRDVHLRNAAQPTE